MTTTDWLPLPTEFRHRLEAALAIGDPVERLERIAALSQFRLGFVETIQLDKALGAVAEDTAPGFARVRLAILASTTIEHLLPSIRIAGLRRRLLIEVYKGSFGQYRQELIDPASGLHGFHPQIVLLSLTCREMIAGVPLAATAEESQSAMSAAITDLRSLWHRARECSGGIVIQQSFLDVTEPLFGSFDRLVPGAPARLVARLNEMLTDAAAEEGTLLLDVARYSARDGIDAHVGLHAADHQTADLLLAQHVQQRCITETVGEILLNDRLIRQRLHTRVKVNAGRAGQEECRARPHRDVLNVNHRPLRAAEMLQ